METTNTDGAPAALAFPECPACRGLGGGGEDDICSLCRGSCHLECEGTDDNCGAPAAALLYDTPGVPMRLCLECLGPTPAPAYETHEEGGLRIVTWIGGSAVAASEAA